MDKETKRIKVGPSQMRAEFMPETFDEEARTVEVVWSTGSKVKRFSWAHGEFLEELSLKKEHVDLDRLNQGAPVLNNHQSWDLRDSIGVVEKAWLKSKAGHAKIRFSAREDVQGIVNDIRDGIIKNISVGYRVEQFEDVSKKSDTIPTLRATKWTPMELSFVNIPADKDSQVRSAQSQSYEVEIIRQEEEPMPNENEKTVVTEPSQTQTRSTPAVTEPKIDLEAVKNEARAEGIKTESARQTEIRSLCKKVGLETSVADEMISGNVKIEDARSQIINKIAEQSASTPTTGHNVEVNDTQEKSRRNAAMNAVEHLYGTERPALIEGAREFCGHDILEVASRYMKAEGIKTEDLSRDDIIKLSIGGKLSGFQRTHVSSDFPFLVADVTNKTLQRAYGEKPQTFAPFVTERAPVNDFKKIQSTKFGDAPVLEKVNEKGEYKEGTISEGKEEYQIVKYGKMISVTEELLRNDDLNAVLQLSEKFGRGTRELESDIVWDIIKANLAMGDGKTLFHADHGNLAGAGAVISVTTVGAGRTAMRKQLGLDKAKIEVRPSFLVVPAALETVAEQFVGATIAAKDADVNPFKGLKIISEVRLDDLSAISWYLFGDASQAEMIEMVKMRGNESPIIETMMAFETDAMKMKVKYHFAAKALDWVAFYKNPGA